MCICVHVYVMRLIICEEREGEELLHAPKGRTEALALWHDSMCPGPAECGKSQLLRHEPFWGARALYFVPVI